ncbi:Ankyrin-like protein, partial [Globisporangium polare]
MDAYHEMRASPSAPASPLVVDLTPRRSHGAPRETFMSRSSTEHSNARLTPTHGHGRTRDNYVQQHQRTKAPRASSAVDPTPRGAPRPLPKYFLGRGYANNAYFAKRLRYWMYALAGLTFSGVASFWMGAKPLDQGGLYVSDITHSVAFQTEVCSPGNAGCGSCATLVAYSVLEYHLLPLVIIIGLPATGWRAFEPFKRGRRTRGDGRAKVTRSLYLQFCELMCSYILVFHILVFFYFQYSLFHGYVVDCKIFRVQLYALGGVLVYVGVMIEIVYFARFREHIKMQLGAFKEADQTGNIRSRINRKGSHFQSERARLIREIRKQLYKETDLGNLRDVENVLMYAQAMLGDDFAEDMYRNASMMCGLFSKSRKNPLHVAARLGSIHALDLLVRAGFDVNSFDKFARLRFSTGDMFWHFAGAVVSKPTQSADQAAASMFKTTLVTPLHLAVSTGQINTVRWLI